MRLLVKLVNDDLAKHVPGVWFDFDDVDQSLRPALAYLLGAFSYTEYLGEEYAKNALRQASRLHAAVGTRAVYRILNEPPLSAGITRTLARAPGDDTGPYKFVDITLSPPLGRQTDATWLALIRFIVDNVVPRHLELRSVFVSNRFVAHHYIYAYARTLVTRRLLVSG